MIVNYCWLITRKSVIDNYRWFFGHFHVFLGNNEGQKSKETHTRHKSEF